MRKFAVVCLVVSLLAVGASAQASASKHPTYALGKAKSCKVHYAKKTERHTVKVRVKVKGKLVAKNESKRYIACVYVTPKPVPVKSPVPTTPPATLPGTTPTTQPPTPSYSYKAHVDPSFVQNQSNPKDVTYTYSADATETLNGMSADLDEANQLPSGVLDLFSDGSLACSVNVGGATDGSTCAVDYSAYGTHSIVTEYNLSGIAPVTETDPEDIEPFSTSASISTPFLGSTVDLNNWAYQVVSVPVTISGLTNSLGTSGTVSLTDGIGTNEGCSALVYNSSLGSASSTCTAEIENDPTVVTSWTPSVSFTGDINYSSTGTTGSNVSIPVAPAPTVTDDTVALHCAESGGFCTEYDSFAETTGADANVDAGFDTSPQVGTVTFTSSDHLLVCTATVYSAANLASNNARCTNTTELSQFSGPISVIYSGGTVEVGDTSEIVYSSATTSGGSN